MYIHLLRSPSLRFFVPVSSSLFIDSRAEIPLLWISKSKFLQGKYCDNRYFTEMFFEELRGRLVVLGGPREPFSVFFGNKLRIKKTFNEKRTSSWGLGGGDQRPIWTSKIDNSIAL